MKHPKSISKFLQVQVKKSDSKPKSQAEVVAIGGRGDAKSESIVLHEDFENYSGITDRLKKSDDLSAKAGSSCFVRFSGKGGGEHLLLIGLGQDKEGIDSIVPQERLRRLGAQTALKLQSERVTNATLFFDSFLMPEAGLEIDAREAIDAFVGGFGLAIYKFEKYLTKKSNRSAKFELTVLAGSSARLSSYLEGVK